MDPSLDALLERVLGRGAVLAVGADADVAPAARRLEAPPDPDGLAGALAAVDDGAFDAALACGWGSELEPVDVARALAPKLRAGGVLAFAAPVARPGVRQRVLGLFRRRRPVALETLCEALLVARLVDIRAAEPDGPLALAWARVPDA